MLPLDKCGLRLFLMFLVQIVLLPYQSWGSVRGQSHNGKKVEDREVASRQTEHWRQKMSERFIQVHKLRAPESRLTFATERMLGDMVLHSLAHLEKVHSDVFMQVIGDGVSFDNQLRIDENNHTFKLQLRNWDVVDQTSAILETTQGGKSQAYEWLAIKNRLMMPHRVSNYVDFNNASHVERKITMKLSASGLLREKMTKEETYKFDNGVDGWEEGRQQQTKYFEY